MPISKKFAEKHLYHASKPPLVIYTDAEYQKAVDEGYGETYVHRDYPKHIEVDGRTLTVNSAAEEAALKGGE